MARSPRKAIFLPPDIYEKVVKAAARNYRTLVAEIEVRFDTMDAAEN